MHRNQHTRLKMSSSMYTLNLLSAALAVAVALSTGCSQKEISATLFKDVTPASGLGEYVGMTYGAAWGDFDGDGLPDLYVTNHLKEARLYRNLGGGRFEDVTTTYFAHEDIVADKHGFAWADYDNDGRLDLVQLTGAVRGVGAEPKILFHNRGDKLVNVAADLGVQNLEGRTRMPLWVDLNGDGRLDLFHGAEARLDDKNPPFVYFQGKSTFAAAAILQFASRSAPFCTLAELTGDNRPELLCRIVGKNRTAQIFDLSVRPPRDLDLLPATAFEDSAAADFDNDGYFDLFLARKNPLGPIALGQESPTGIVADVLIDKSNVDKPMGFTFRTQGTLRLQVSPGSPNETISAQQVHLGQQGTHPSGLKFELSPAAPAIRGMPSHETGKESGVYVGFTAPDKWEVRVTAPRLALKAGKPKNQQLQLRVDSTTAIDELQATGEEIQPEEAPARLFMNRAGKLVEESDKRGVNARQVSGMNVVGADFDNDMDVDLFVLASGNIGQQENLLLLNDGTGHFQVVKAAGGAAGSLAGVGDSATTVDFDGDGFLDLLLANGESMGRSLGLPSDRGGYQLFRNVGNGNHWIMIDLEGTTSNRDGIGAIVHVTAGGVTQMRVQDGGVHHRSQNHSRLHFGLASNAQIEKITVQWPSGQTQVLTNVKAGRVLRIKEPVLSAQGVAAQR